MYARVVARKVLTFCVSGMLWNRSLVMMDTETQTLWSHILGEAMEGKLKGAVLKTIPSDMITWKAWRERHPRTTVLNLSRTNEDYKKTFYRDPTRFVFGWVEGGRAYSASFAVLQEHAVVNAGEKDAEVVVAFDPESTSALLYSRRVGDRILTFVAENETTLKDVETQTLWHAPTGKAVKGKLKGKRLEPKVGIVSYARAWSTFHPDSRTVTPGR